MTQSTRIIPKGLVTEPSRLAAGDGGLIRAQNVICRAPGLIEPRAMLRGVVNTAARTAGYNGGVHCREWDGLTASALNNGSNIRVYRENEAAPPLIAMSGYNEDTDRVFSEVADGRAIWAFPNGLRCMDQATQAAKTVNGTGAQRRGQGAFARMPGAPRITMNLDPIVPAAATGALGPQETAAYRLTVVRYMTNDFGTIIPIESPPSDRLIAYNTSAVNHCYVQLRYNLQEVVGGATDFVDVRNGDELRIYRTTTNGAAFADPGDEMQLRHTEKIKFDAFGNLDILRDFVDRLAVTEWSGPALYTNESQEGATRANYRLRSARDVTTYQGKLFYGGGSAGWRKSVVIKHIGIPADTTNYSETLLSCFPPGAVNWTNGSPVITGVAANVFPRLSIGQFVSTTGNNPVGSTMAGDIIAFDATLFTITLNANATANGAGTISIYDWVGFETDYGEKWRVFFPGVAPGGTVYPAVGTPGGSYPTTTYGPIMPTQNNGTVNVPMHGGIESGFGTIYYSEFGSSNNDLIPRMFTETGADPNRDITLTIEWDASFADPGATDNLNTSSEMPKIAITSSKPFAFSEQLAPTYADSRPANADGNVATLWWSKTNQPESVPLGNFAIIGDSSEPIVRIFGTTDRLWVLKTDGLYLVYGSGDTADSLTIQPVDATFKMIDGPESNCSAWAAKIRDTVYAWTQGGIVAIDTQGVRRIDDDIATFVRNLTPGFTADQTQVISGSAFGCASVRDQLVVFGIRGAICLVYCVDGGTWGTWTSNSLAGGLPTQQLGTGVSEAGMLRLSGGNGYWTYVDVPSANMVNSTDVEPYIGDELTSYTAILNVDTVSGKAIETTVTGFPIGTRFQASNGLWVRIVSGAPNTGSYTLDRTGCSTGDALAVHYPANHVITFSANQPPMVEKHFTTAWVHWQRIRGGTRYYVDWRARGHNAGEAGRFTMTYDDSDGAGYPHTIDHDLEFDDAISTPTQVSRARGLEVTLTQSEADVYFQMDGLTIESKTETPRVERRR